MYGASTEIGGDFAPGAWWTNNATDKMLRDLSTDYYTVVTDQGGAYVVNNTVTDSIEGTVNEDGTKTFTIKVKEGLTYNNGDPITIKDFRLVSRVLLLQADDRCWRQADRLSVLCRRPGLLRWQGHRGFRHPDSG